MRHRGCFELQRVPPEICPNQRQSSPPLSPKKQKELSEIENVGANLQLGSTLANNKKSTIFALLP